LSEEEPGELVDDRLEEEEMPTAIHELLVVALAAVLRAWVAPRGGLVFGSELKLGVGPRRGRKADIAVCLPGGPRPSARASMTRVPPGLVVEVVSPTPRDGRRDRVEKVDDYARFGVRYYWIVDPELRTLEIHELGPDGRYARALGATEGVLDHVPGCDGLVLDLGALWAEVDRFIAESPTDDGADIE
jgi:Uma2 family endonuclease